MIFNYGGTIYRKAEAPTIGKTFKNRPKTDRERDAKESEARAKLIASMELFRDSKAGFFADAIPAATIRGDSGRVLRFD